MSALAGVVSIILLPYLAGVAFYHSHPRRCPLTLAPTICRALRWTAWALLLLSFLGTIYLLGVTRGFFYQLFAAPLVMLVSLLFATRWPHGHWYSGFAGCALTGLMVVL